MTSLRNRFPGDSAWRWGVCGLLLLATMINYMDRQTLNQTSKRIKTQFAENDNRLYARLESGFGLAFAFGSVMSGLIVDRIGVRRYYPLMVCMWSGAGFATELVESYNEMLLCRVMLGIFEGANWPCALYATQKILTSEKRTMGNGILQSGASIGAIFTPLIVLPFLDETNHHWRYPFLIIGAIGLVWVAAWVALIRPGTIPVPAHTARTSAPGSIWTVFADGRFWVLAFVVVAINLTWHFFRVWMPLI